MYNIYDIYDLLHHNITLILAFCHHAIFFPCFRLHLLFFRSFTTEGQINLKILTWLGKSLSQALEMLQQTYGNDTVSCTRIFEWHKWFKEEHEKVEMTR